MSGTRYCIWGGRRGDVWVGSTEDRWLQSVVLLDSTCRRQMVAVGRALQPAVAALADGVRSLIEGRS